MKKDEITKYIEAMYSEKSTLNEIQDLSERKREAAKKAGLNPDDENVKAIMRLKNEPVNVRIFDYLVRTQTNAYISLISDQELFWQIQFDKMKPSDATDAKERMKDMKLRTSMSKESTELLNRITYAYREIFRYDEEMGMAHRLIRNMTPEQRVKLKSA